eukprot:gene11240-18865_t
MGSGSRSRFSVSSRYGLGLVRSGSSPSRRGLVSVSVSPISLFREADTCPAPIIGASLPAIDKVVDIESPINAAI